MNPSLYKGVSSPPSAEFLLSRPQVDKLLAQAIQKPLTTVVAGAGYGKTQSVSAFLRRTGAKSIWLQLSTIDNLTSRFWEHLVYSISLRNDDVAANYAKLGFPENAATLSALLQIVAVELERAGNYFLVLDDFHMINEKSIFHLIEQVVQAQIKGLSLILISRTDPPIGTMGFMSKGLLACITEQQLRFSQDEIASYYALQGLQISKQGIADIYGITDGWIFAVYLISLTLNDDVVYDKVPLSVIKFDMHKLIDAELFCNISEALQQFLIKLSFVDNLKAELLQMLSADTPQIIQELMGLKSFIQYDGIEHCFHMHMLFQDFLREKHALLPQAEIRAFNLSVATWYADHGYQADAVTHFQKAGNYERIVPFLAGAFSNKSADYILGLLGQVPHGVFEQNPLLTLIRAKTYLTLFRYDDSLALIMPLKNAYEALPPSEERNAVLGEVNSLLGLISLITTVNDGNDSYLEYYTLADAYLPSGSKVFDGSVHFNQGTYCCMVGAAHYQAGFLDQYLKTMSEAMPYTSRVMHGSGTGVSPLQMTEAAYFRRDFKAAQKYAQQAIYAAQEMGQFDIEAMALFYLIRMHIALCHYKEIMSLLERMAMLWTKFNRIELMVMLHIAQGWFFAAIGLPEAVPSWIMKETNDYSEVTEIDFCIYRLVRSKCQLVQKNHYDLLAFTEQQHNPYGIQNFLIGAIELHVLKAVALNLLDEKDQAIATLEEAYRLAHPNGLIMPFIEQGTQMRTLTQGAMKYKGCAIPRQWLENINVKSSAYAKKIHRLAAEHHAMEKRGAAQPGLTQRETEVLSHLCYGLTREEIAVECNLSVNTIKSMMANICQKLGASNSYDAVRIAIKRGIEL